MKARAAVLALAISLAWVLSGCAGTVTSRILEPILSSEEIDLEVDSFLARKRGAGYLQLDVVVQHDVADYEPGFELEFAHAAKLCAAFANRDATFSIDWWALNIRQFIRYGGKSRWHAPTYSSHTDVLIYRDTLLGLRDRVSLADECPYLWRLDKAIKSGPCNKYGYCTFGSPWPEETPAERER